MKKTYALIALLLALSSVLLCACGEKDPAPPAPAVSASQSAADPVQPANDLPDVLFEGPVLVISIGQSADISIAKNIMNKVGVDYTVYEEGGSMEGFKSAMLVPGVSVKGLGAAGISVDDELDDTKDILDQLESADVKIIVAHLGGSSRRDELTDQFLDAVFPSADFICALEEGNKDGKFTDYAAANSIPCSIAADVVAMVNTISAVYGNAK